MAQRGTGEHGAMLNLEQVCDRGFCRPNWHSMSNIFVSAAFSEILLLSAIRWQRS
jgi:hypothetical protein